VNLTEAQLGMVGTVVADGVVGHTTAQQVRKLLNPALVVCDFRTTNKRVAKS
jgi:hypothetical protein